MGSQSTLIMPFRPADNPDICASTRSNHGRRQESDFLDVGGEQNPPEQQ
jgi:hypothetical protein